MRIGCNNTYNASRWSANGRAAIQRDARALRPLQLIFVRDIHTRPANAGITLPLRLGRRRNIGPPHPVARHWPTASVRRISLACVASQQSGSASSGTGRGRRRIRCCSIRRRQCGGSRPSRCWPRLLGKWLPPGRANWRCMKCAGLWRWFSSLLPALWCRQILPLRLTSRTSPRPDTHRQHESPADRLGRRKRQRATRRAADAPGLAALVAESMRCGWVPYFQAVGRLVSGRPIYYDEDTAEHLAALDEVTPPASASSPQDCAGSAIATASHRWVRGRWNASASAPPAACSTAACTTVPDRRRSHPPARPG